MNVPSSGVRAWLETVAASAPAAVGKDETGFTAVFLENAYLKLTVAPWLGGRLLRATDRACGYDLVREGPADRTGVSPSVGLSRPVDWMIEEGPDGGRTVWCSGIDLVTRLRRRHGFTLHPDRSSLGVTVRLSNRSGGPQLVRGEDHLPFETNPSLGRGDGSLVGYDAAARVGLLRLPDRRAGPFAVGDPSEVVWLMPGEEKSFALVFYTFRRIGRPKNSDVEAALCVEVDGGAARVGVHATSPREVLIRTSREGTPLFETAASLTPDSPFLGFVPLPEGTGAEGLTVEVVGGSGRIVAYTFPAATDGPSTRPVPELGPTAAASAPAEVATVEELYLQGLRRERAGADPASSAPYYEEALRHDPAESRCNTAMGRWLLRRGEFAAAEPFLRRAVERLTAHGANPSDAGPLYHLGRCLTCLDRADEADAAFARSALHDAWTAPSSFERARLAARRGDLGAALDLLDAALVRNARHEQARHLRAALLRRLGREDGAVAETTALLALDPLDPGALHERRLLRLPADPGRQPSGGPSRSIELALDYAHAGLFGEAHDLLRDAPRTDPTVLYLDAWFHTLAGDPDGARAALAEARSLAADGFESEPIECIPALGSALAINPRDWLAAFGLGNALDSRGRADEAIAAWEHCRSARPEFPAAHRRLSSAYLVHRRDPRAALSAIEAAFALDPNDARVFSELDQIRKRLNHSRESRLARLETHRDLVEGRDDLTLERVALLNALGRHAEALTALLGRDFRASDGGELTPSDQYLQALIGLARGLLDDRRPADALSCLVRARTLPPNLGTGARPGVRESQVLYWLAQAHRALGDVDRARQALEQAAGAAVPGGSLAGGDVASETDYYQALALRSLGRADEAQRRFERLIASGRELVDSHDRSTPAPNDPPDRLAAHGHYLTALGRLGIGPPSEAAAAFDRVLDLDRCHLGALTHRAMVEAPLGAPSADVPGDSDDPAEPAATG